MAETPGAKAIDRIGKTEQPSFFEALRFWFILGWISFGGTTGHITIMHDFLVEKKKWISNSKFFHALNACMILPGPEAHQLSIYIGWKLHGIKGGIVSGILFVLPSICILLGLSIVYAMYGNTPLLMSVFAGLKPAVLAIILFATWKVGKKALSGIIHYVVAIASFGLSYFTHISMPWIILGVIVLAILVSVINPAVLHLKKDKQADDSDEELYYINSNQKIATVAPKILLRQFLFFLFIWAVPFTILVYFMADASFWKQLSLFFTKTAFLTIGGSYTVIPYVAALVTGKLAWLSRTQMIDGFALAETTPGPLVIVLSYVGFMSAYNHFGNSLLMGSIGLIVTSYFTFLPNFVLIFLGASFMEKAQESKIIQGVLSLITAVVVGVIVNLAFYLGGDILFRGKSIALTSVNWYALGWALFSLFLLVKCRMKIFYLVLISIGYGIAYYFFHR